MQGRRAPLGGRTGRVVRASQPSDPAAVTLAIAVVQLPSGRNSESRLEWVSRAVMAMHGEPASDCCARPRRRATPRTRKGVPDWSTPPGAVSE